MAAGWSPLVTYRRRHVSLPAHGAIAVLLGMVMFLAPAVLHFGVAGLVLAATLMTGVQVCLNLGTRYAGLARTTEPGTRRPPSKDLGAQQRRPPK